MRTPDHGGRGWEQDEAIMAVPAMNNDIIRGARDRRTGQYNIAPADQLVLLRVVGDLQFRIAKEMGPRDEGPLRCLIPMAMRFTEQAGRVSFRRPEGNNPYNIMGSGVDRPENTEYERGRVVHRPASFQGYKSEAEGIATFFRALRTWHGGAWKGAWEAIRDVSSFKDFAQGLRPKGGPNYLTKPLRAHISGLTGRGVEAIKLLEIVYKNERVRIRRESADDEILFPALLNDPYFGPDTMRRLKASRQGIRNAEQMLRRLAATRAKLAG